MMAQLINSGGGGYDLVKTEWDKYDCTQPQKHNNGSKWKSICSYHSGKIGETQREQSQDPSHREHTQCSLRKWEL
jgi:hypothetical protein